MTTKEFTETEVSTYLDDPDADDLGNISTCLRVIGRHEVDSPDRDAEMVAAAMDNIASWASDYGIDLEFDVR